MFARRTVILSLAIAVVSCSSGNGTSSTPSVGDAQRVSSQTSLDAVLDSAPEVANGREVFKKMSVHPPAGAPPILINFLADGPNQAGVPCIDCVNGASTGDNIGMTGPYSYVAANFVWQYEMSFSDMSYKGKCKLAWAITSGKTTIDSFSKTIDLTSDGGFVLYAVARPRPKYSGPATLTGKVTCGKTAQSLQVPLQFE
ncbi:MAG: hypothetical protein JOZ77_12600 [Candidatus Eremiobacteraeota bacterium]|nr:hypothetical protein [Candidatus Eremiobacteraeota bacterium]